MFFDKVRFVLYLNSMLLVFLLAGAVIVYAKGIADASQSTSPIHKDSVLSPGQSGKDLIGEIVGVVGQGKAVYFKYCVYCHGKTGRGDGMVAIGLSPSPADLSQTFAKLRLENKQSRLVLQRLFDIVTYGRKGSRQIRMPAWGPVLSKQDRMDVLAYIESMFAQ